MNDITVFSNEHFDFAYDLLNKNTDNFTSGWRALVEGWLSVTEPGKGVVITGTLLILTGLLLLQVM